jgi:hypothetical protein
MAEGTHPQPTLLIVLADEVTSGRIVVPFEAYADLCLRMEQDLRALEDRFAAFAVVRKNDLRSQWR